MAVSGHRRRYRWALAALLAAVCLAVGFLIRPIAAPTRIEPWPFEFQAGQIQDHLVLTWNPASRAVLEATGATLAIHDGPETEDVALSLTELRRGSLSYRPIFQDVSFRLSLANSSRRTVSEQAHLSFRP